MVRFGASGDAWSPIGRDLLSIEKEGQDLGPFLVVSHFRRDDRSEMVDLQGKTKPERELKFRRTDFWQAKRSIGTKTRTMKELY